MELVRPQSPTSGMSGHSDMVWISGGTFRMGSDRHYAEEGSHPGHKPPIPQFRACDGLCDLRRDRARSEGLSRRSA